MLQLVHAFEKASGKKIEYKIAPRRAGDIAEFYANTDKAKKMFGWQAEYGIEKMCADSWNFTEKNPNGL